MPSFPQKGFNTCATLFLFTGIQTFESGAKQWGKYSAKCTVAQEITNYGN